MTVLEPSGISFALKNVRGHNAPYNPLTECAGKPWLKQRYEQLSTDMEVEKEKRLLCWRTVEGISWKLELSLLLAGVLWTGFVRSVPSYLARKNIKQKSWRYQVGRTKFKTQQNYGTVQVFMHLNVRHQSWCWPVRLLIVRVQLTVVPDSCCKFWKPGLHPSIFDCADLYPKNSSNGQHA